jgi:hypothetical protein
MRKKKKPLLIDTLIRKAKGKDADSLAKNEGSIKISPSVPPRQSSRATHYSSN